MKKKKPYESMSLLDFQDKFPTEEICLNYLINMKWPDGVKCSYCSHDHLDFIKKRKLFHCRRCQKQTYVTANTIFQKTRTPLRKWFWMIYLMATSKKGMSMLYFQQQLGIKSYRTAWLMCHKIRQAMIQRDGKYTLGGVVEADDDLDSAQSGREIFIGGKQSLENRRINGDNKTPFLIAVEEDFNGGPKFLSFEELETIYENHVILAPRRDKVIQH